MTSTILKDFQKFINDKKQNKEDLKIPRPSAQNEEGGFLAQGTEQFERRRADLLDEGNSFSKGNLDIKKVQSKTENSGFSYFLDGIERKKIILYFRQIPFIYGYVAAAILERKDKILSSCDLELSEETFYIPIKEDENCPEHYLDYSEIKHLKNYKNIGKNIKKSDKEGYPLFPAEFIQQAHSEIQESRRKIENRLSAKWINLNDKTNDKGWLFVDGTLNTKSSEILSCSNIAGIVKSHGVYYFDFDDMHRVYSMPKGFRTVAFQPYDSRGRKKDIFTWYLRLHYDNRSGANEFGIVRVEIPAKEELIDMIDEISNWILLETKPVGFPASRWDRMIYPIKFCEDYLKSKAPSWYMIQSFS